MAKFKLDRNKATENVGGKTLSEKAEIYENKEKFDIRFIEISKIVPNPYNEKIYELSGIESLAENIKEYGLNQNLEVNEVEENGEKIYRLIGGHRRFKAIQLLREQGVGENFDKIPCKVERNLSELEEKIRLLKSNSDTRELTNEEKRKQNEEITKLVKEYAEATGKKINVKKEVAKQTGQDIKTVERYDNINNRLIPQLQEYFDNKEISFADAYKFAVLDEQMQLAVLELLQSKDKITKEELTAIRNENKKLVELAEEKEKELETTRKELSQKEQEVENLESEKNSLEQEVENNKVEQEVIEEERKKLEAKIREEISLLTEEELNKTKEALKEAEEKAKELEGKEKELNNQLKAKEKEHQKALEEYKENLSKKEEIQEEKEAPTPTITKEQIEKEVAKAKLEDIKVNVTKELIELGNIIKKNSLTDGAETIVAEMEKALEVLKNKIANANKKQSSK